MSRLARLLGFVALCLVLAACGGGPAAEVTTADTEIEEPSDISETDELRVESGAVEADLEEDVIDEIDDVEPIVPDAPVITSPVGRQDAQRVGGAERDADSTEGNTSASAASAADASVGDSIGEGAQAASVADAPTGPVIDIPLPEEGVSNDPVSDAPPAPFVSAGGPIADSSADSCGTSCEIGGLEPELIEDDPLTETETETAVGSEPSATAPGSSNEDAICPDVAAADCVEADSALADGAGGADRDVGDEPEEPEPTCDERPWMVGCDGPVPAPEDYEFQEVIRESDQGESGVQVPQEVQDALLAPIED